MADNLSRKHGKGDTVTAKNDWTELKKSRNIFFLAYHHLVGDLLWQLFVGCKKMKFKPDKKYTQDRSTRQLLICRMSFIVCATLSTSTLATLY